MSVNSVSNSAVTNTAANTAAATNTTAEKKEQAGASASTSNTSTSAASTPASVYTKSGIDKAMVDKLLKESQYTFDSVKSLLQRALGIQADKFEKGWGNLDFSNVDDATREAARKDIAEDGYFGVKQTSERILDFAKALSGGDPSKIAELRDSIEAGFKAAEEAWGKELPQISKDTMAAVRAGLDEWEKSFQTSEDAE